MALTAISHEKILYGSDYPLLQYPQTHKQPDFRPFIEDLEGLNLDAEVFADIMGLNTARLLGLVEDERALREVPQPEAAQKSAPAASEVTTHMPVRAIASTWPETRAVFDKYNLPYEDCPVPFWEPLSQSAAARGYGPSARQRILDELKEAASLSKAERE
jgi:hypothetical protein